MKKKIIKLIMSCVSVCMIMQVFVNTNILALTVNPGGGFSGTLACGVYEGPVYVVGSNATITSGVNWCDRGVSVTASAAAGGAGTASIIFKAGSGLVNTNTMTEVAAGTTLSSASVSVANNTGGGNTGGGNTGGGNTGGGNTGGGNTGGGNTTDDNNSNNSENENEKEEENKSEKDLSLASLSVSVGKLSPAFDPITTSYNVELTSDIKDITVDAKTADSSVKLEGTGKHTLKEGENKIVITVSDDEGNKKTYTVIANVEKKPTVYLPLNDSKDKLGVLTLQSAPKLEGFEDYKLKINNEEVTGRKKMKTGLVVLYMVDSKTNDRNFYIYDEKAKKLTSIYIPIALLGNQYAIITIPDELKKMTGFNFGKVKVDKQSFEGWSFKDKAFKNYSLIYLMDENDKPHLYQYEKESNTLQLFSNAAPVTQSTYEKLVDDSKKMDIFKVSTIVLAGAVVILLAIAIMMKIKMNKTMKRFINRS